MEPPREHDLEAKLSTNEEKRRKSIKVATRRVKDPQREFEKLYRQSYNLVYSYVRARIGTDADTEDIVAEAYLKAARYFDSFDPSRAKFSTWVITIAKNCMISHFRKARPTSALDNVSEELFAEPGGQDSVDDKVLADLLIGCLDDEETELVLLKYHEGYRNVEIAEHMNVNASTVSTKLARAIAKMRAAAKTVGA